MHISVNDTVLYVDVEGAQLRVQNGRPGTRPTVVVLHGGPGFDQAYLRPDLGRLADLVQLVFVDLRGQGRSRPVAVPTCTLEQMADDVVALCARLGLDHPILLGHSAGGFVALHAALRQPDAVSGLVLCNTTATLAGEPDPDAPTLLSRAGPEAAAVAARLFGGDMSRETTAAFDRLVAPHYAAPGHEDVPARLFPLSPLNARIAQHFFTELAPAYDLRARLGEITVPTLVVAGAYDWVCPPSASRTLAAGIPNATLCVVPDAGHFAFAEEPERFRAALTELLAARTRPGTARTSRPAHRVVAVGVKSVRVTVKGASRPSSHDRTTRTRL
jgi:proline iminopeptidase